jgi:hypothetical protein
LLCAWATRLDGTPTTITGAFVKETVPALIVLPVAGSTISTL